MELPNNLSELTLKDYFFKMREVLGSVYDLESLTDLLSNGDFNDIKPLLNIRKLVPKDNRFSSIDLVYDKPENVVKIRWYLNIKLSELIEYFGAPRFYFTPHGGRLLLVSSQMILILLFLNLYTMGM